MMEDKDRIHQLQIEITLLNERYEKLYDQSEHIKGLYVSEQRVSVNQGKRIDQNFHMIETIQKVMEKHERMLTNNGRGLLFDVDRLKQRAENNKANLALWISLISTAAAIISIIVR